MRARVRIDDDDEYSEGFGVRHGGLRQVCVLSSPLFAILIVAVTTVRLAMQRLSADAGFLACLVHLDEGVPREVGGRGGGGGGRRKCPPR